MIQNILRTLGGIEQYGVFSLCLFSCTFAGVFLWACLQRRSHLERMAKMPLETEAAGEAPANLNFPEKDQSHD